MLKIIRIDTIISKRGVHLKTAGRKMAFEFKQLERGLRTDKART